MAWIHEGPIVVDGHVGVGCVAVVQMANEKTRVRMGGRDARLAVEACTYEGMKGIGGGREGGRGGRAQRYYNIMSDWAFILGTAHL